MAIKPIGPKVESQPLNDNFSYLESEKVGRTELTNTIAQKADKTYVDSQLAQKRDKGVPIKGTELDISADANKIKLINLSNEVQAAMAGTSPVLPTVADGSITTEKIAPEGVKAANVSKPLLTGILAPPTYGDVLNVDLVNGKVEFLVSPFYLVWGGNNSITFSGLTGTSITWEVDPSNTFRYLVVNMNTRTFSIVKRAEITDVHILVGIISLESGTGNPKDCYINAMRYRINGKTFGHKTVLDAMGSIEQAFADQQNINLDYSNRLIDLEEFTDIASYRVPLSHPVTTKDTNIPANNLITVAHGFDTSAYIGQSITVSYQSYVGKRGLGGTNFRDLRTFIWDSNGDLANYNPTGSVLITNIQETATDWGDNTPMLIERSFTYTVTNPTLFVIAAMYAAVNVTGNIILAASMSLTINGSPVDPVLKGFGKNFGESFTLDWLGRTYFINRPDDPPSPTPVEGSIDTNPHYGSYIIEGDFARLRAKILQDENAQMVILGDSTEAGVGWRYDANGDGYAERGDIMKPPSLEAWYLHLMFTSPYFKKPPGLLTKNGIFDVLRVTDTETLSYKLPEGRTTIALYYLGSGVDESFTVSVNGGTPATISKYVPPVTYGSNTIPQQGYSLQVVEFAASGDVTLKITGSVDIVGVYLGKPMYFKNYAIRGTTLTNNSSRNQQKGITTDERFAKAFAMNPLIYVMGWSSNDAYDGVTPETIYNLYKARINQIRAQNSQAIIILYGDYCEGYANHTAVQQKIRQLAIDMAVTYIDVNGITTKWPASQVVNDYVHLNQKGYEINAEFLNKWLDHGLGKPTVTSSPYLGKKAVFLGDSITYGLVNRPNIGDVVSRRFSDIVADELGMVVVNYGISSSTIAVNPDAPTERNPMVERYASMDPDADVVIVFGGTNDWQYNWTPLGNMSSRDNTTFYGALHNLCLGLLDRYKGKQIVFLTPMKRSQSPYTAPDARNANGKTLAEYAEIIEEVCAYYGIPVLNLHKELTINPFITAQKDLLIPDGTHPNDMGHELIAKRLIGFLKQLA